jgi:hypothetical protein
MWLISNSHTMMKPCYDMIIYANTVYPQQGAQLLTAIGHYYFVFIHDVQNKTFCWASFLNNLCDIKKWNYTTNIYQILYSWTKWKVRKECVVMHTANDKTYCHAFKWQQTEFGLVTGFTEHLQIVTTSNHSAIANSHTLQFTTACTKVFIVCLVMVSNAVAPSASYSMAPVLAVAYLTTRFGVPMQQLTTMGATICDELQAWNPHSSRLTQLRVRVTLQLAVYRPSVQLGVNPWESWPEFFFQLNPCHVPIL